MADESSQKVLESKRLFVGGLNHGVNMEELRAKFQPFGNVKDLELITRKDDSGVPLKTFAYMSIDVSEKDFKKCLTIYNNCTWKGNVLKIQVAKEDYLSRLQKEKILKTVNRKRVVSVDTSEVVPDMKSAVPGTPVPEKRNWVVGKFGRALPIVFLRRKDGKKVAKFDPSKTVHCVKKIRVDDKQSQSVNSLTWDIESSCPDVREISKKCDSKKRLVDDVEKNDEDMIPRKARRKRNDFETVCLPGVIDCGFDNESKSSFHYGKMSKSAKSKDSAANPSKSEIESPDDDDSSTKDNDDSFLHDEVNSVSEESEKDLSSDSDESTDDDNPLKIGHYLQKQNEPKEPQESVHRSDAFNINGNTSPSASVNGYDKNTNEVILRNDENDSNSNDICVTDSLSDSSSEDSFLQNDSLSNKEYQISSSNVAMSEIDSNSSRLKKDLFNSASCSQVNGDLTSSEKESLFENTPESQHMAEPTVNSSSSLRKIDWKKSKVSNSLRLESLNERTQIIQKQKDIVRNALQKIDSDHFKGNNHLILDENDEGLEKPPVEGKKITGTKALSWLGMDSASDDDDDDDGKNQNEEAFGWKEHFDGKTGEKLMKLQQKFGHDERFKMDERFLESDEGDSDSKKYLQEKTQKHSSSEVGDEIDRQLEEEKQLSFKVLQDILGRNSIFMVENDDSRNQYRDSLTTRYDPSREDHAEFEENIVKPTRPELKKNDVAPKKTSETELPVVTKSTFYSVSDSLKSLFEKKNQESNTFSFFTDLNENEECNKNVIEKSENITKWKVPVELSEQLPYDSSASEVEDEQEEITSEVVSSTKKQRHLFYHPENKTMMDTLEEESSSFMRKESIESLKKYWLEVRQNLTQDYKKKRKDALRRQKKMSHKQNS